VEVKIGVQNVNREIVLESSQSPQDVAALIAKALEGRTLELADEKGRMIVVPTTALAYVEIGAEETRRVGFGAL
jgi:hypothetical protein